MKAILYHELYKIKALKNGTSLIFFPTLFMWSKTFFFLFNQFIQVFHLTKLPAHSGYLTDLSLTHNQNT